MNKKLFIAILVVGLMAILGGSAVVFYLWNMPHRDVVAATPDFTLSSEAFISEYFENSDAANIKYLSEDGDSKIVVLSGLVASISSNQAGDKVVLIKESDAKVGVAFTFTPDTNASASALQAGQPVSIKGVVRSGPRLDEFLGVYSNAVLEKASLY